MYTFNEKEHIHLLDGQPLYGTTTVIKEVMPPFLAKWGAQCAVDFLKVALAEKLELTEEIFNDAVKAWSKTRDKAAKKGIDMHAELEAYVKSVIAKEPYTVENEKVAVFAQWAEVAVDKFIFAEKYTYSKELWVGGVVDCLAKMRDGSLAVIDFKSSPKAYFNQFAQAAGYALQLEESGYGNADGSDWRTLEGKITKLYVVPFGAKELKPENIGNVPDYKKVFEHIVRIYEFQRSFNAD